MKKSIIEYLSKHQGFISVDTLAKVTKSSKDAIKKELQNIAAEFPRMIETKTIRSAKGMLFVKIREQHSDIAKSLLL